MTIQKCSNSTVQDLAERIRQRIGSPVVQRVSAVDDTDSRDGGLSFSELDPQGSTGSFFERPILISEFLHSVYVAKRRHRMRHPRLRGLSFRTETGHWAIHRITREYQTSWVRSEDAILLYQVHSDPESSEGRRKCPILIAKILRGEVHVLGEDALRDEGIARWFLSWEKRMRRRGIDSPSLCVEEEDVSKLKSLEEECRGHQILRLIRQIKRGIAETSEDLATQKGVLKRIREDLDAKEKELEESRRRLGNVGTKPRYDIEKLYRNRQNEDDVAELTLAAFG